MVYPTKNTIVKFYLNTFNKLTGLCQQFTLLNHLYVFIEVVDCTTFVLACGSKFVIVPPLERRFT